MRPGDDEVLLVTLVAVRDAVASSTGSCSAATAKTQRDTLTAATIRRKVHRPVSQSLVRYGQP